jgi:hypothetical protein
MNDGLFFPPLFGGEGLTPTNMYLSPTNFTPTNLLGTPNGAISVFKFPDEEPSLNGLSWSEDEPKVPTPRNLAVPPTLPLIP